MLLQDSTNSSSETSPISSPISSPKPELKSTLASSLRAHQTQREQLKIALISQRKCIIEKSGPKSRPLLKELMAGRMLSKSVSESPEKEREPIIQLVNDYSMAVNTFGLTVADALMNQKPIAPLIPPPAINYYDEFDMDDDPRCFKKQKTKFDVDLNQFEDVEYDDDWPQVEMHWSSDELDDAITAAENAIPIKLSCNISPPQTIPDMNRKI
jgi:hypothetical protein